MSLFDSILRGDNLAATQKFSDTGDIKVLGRVLRNNILIEQGAVDRANAEAVQAVADAERRIALANDAAAHAEAEVTERPLRRQFEADLESRLSAAAAQRTKASDEDSIDNDALVEEFMNF